MSSKHFFYTEGQPGTSNLESRTGGEAVTVTPNLPGKPDCQEVFLGISMDFSSAERGEAWAALDANELRDAIDKAMGPREPERVFHYHPGPDGTTPPAERVSLDDAVWEKLGWTTQDGGSSTEPWEGRKPYRPLDRDRLLRHIEDVEAALTRRNERHERDQERIRELEVEVSELRESLLLNTGAKTAREHLELAWSAAIVPEDGMIHVGEAFLCKDESGIRQPVLGNAGHAIRVNDCGVERRLMEPRVEPSKEDSYRKELEGKGLAEWEVQILLEAGGGK